jgi:hypothetical protein
MQRGRLFQNAPIEQCPISNLIGICSTSLFERADSADLTIPPDRHLL